MGGSIANAWGSSSLGGPSSTHGGVHHQGGSGLHQHRGGTGLVARGGGVIFGILGEVMGRRIKGLR
ncbi:hypothetical protein TIFTF001_032378 [Ficus carica]|uniref:Uncharacterized protein n=1 Tax=Ficus carica TaxID=3494 RepID=A0AA88DW97_FICCA|nr:hypothetical protein TIFTF001_032330 [Ficus carica]GMN63302.1 hypothetical protein TIFTF001_032378 [Ficus carica]